MVNNNHFEVFILCVILFIIIFMSLFISFIIVDIIDEIRYNNLRANIYNDSYHDGL
jgi:hypothetical protein